MATRVLRILRGLDKEEFQKFVDGDFSKAFQVVREPDWDVPNEGSKPLAALFSIESVSSQGHLLGKSFAGTSVEIAYDPETKSGTVTYTW